eukprot:320039_1
MFDPVHCLKALRNALSHSKYARYNIKKQKYPLQNGSDVITWEHIVKIHNDDVGFDWAQHRTLSNAAVYLNPWSRQRVNLALNVFDINVVSALKFYQKNGHPVDGTLEYIEAVRAFLVGTFVAKSKANGGFDKIYGPKNEMIGRIDTMIGIESTIESIHKNIYHYHQYDLASNPFARILRSFIVIPRMALLFTYVHIV